MTMLEWYEVVLVVLAAGVFYLALSWVFPSLVRPVLWLFARVCYRFTVYHRDRIPATGGALIVANHVSYIDWLVFALACPRPVTFVLWGRYYRNSGLR
jgi:acyl-[acyl-carrier-protein]-phospholipid O-acyltransferase / long-chain-fatty-acid--[acyl-carrier-protein] ligase